ncbi:hypothetical protein DFJ74DRAFT_693100 [Hyaloraphidium curvatum]|nr:hypothetical protein DFJ74DRAFT_693100 [Hyaloraphidium curvatum]
MTLDRRPRTIAVIGGGASGIIAAKELRDVGGFALESVTVFELQHAIGGVWVLTEGSPLDLDFRDPNFAKRDPYDSTSLYPDLRTQMPVSAVQFRDFPVPPNVEMFPRAQVVAEYIQAYSDHHGVTPRVKLNTKVDQLYWNADRKTWTVVTRRKQPKSQIRLGDFDSAWGDEVRSEFDAVVVASGHYTFPTVPSIPGQESFPARFIHSHDFRDPADFRGLNVLIIGSGTSATDQARLLWKHARKVWVSTRDSRIWEVEKLDDFVRDRGAPLQKVAAVAEFVANGGRRAAILEDGSAIEDIGAVILATGYRFEFPFLRKGSAHGPLSDVGADLPPGKEYEELIADGTGRTVKNLWKKVIYTRNPSLAFVGLPLKILSFPLFEFQSAVPAKLWSGQVSIPQDPEHLLRLEEEEARSYGAADRNDRLTMLMTAFQWDYQDGLSDFLGIWRFGEERKKEIVDGVKWWFTKRYAQVHY